MTTPPHSVTGGIHTSSLALDAVRCEEGSIPLLLGRLAVAERVKSRRNRRWMLAVRPAAASMRAAREAYPAQEGLESLIASEPGQHGIGCEDHRPARAFRE
jgi:hypothetical protein